MAGRLLHRVSRFRSGVNIRSPAPHLPLQVLHVVPWLASGGVERRRLAIARHLPPQRWQLTIFALSAEPAMCADFEAEGVRVITSDAPAWSLRTLSALRRCIRDVRPTIVHGAVFEGSTLAAVVGRLQRVPIVLLEETSDTERRSARAHTAFRALAGVSDGCVAISERVARTLVHRTGLPSHRVYAVPTGAPTPRPVPVHEVAAFRERVGIPPSRRLVGTVCRMIPLKRLGDLVDALLHPAWPCDTDLLLVGRGPEEPALRARVTAHGLTHRVHFAGYQHDIAPPLAALDVFAMVPVFEGLGLAAVEAMLVGLPIVATRHGGLGDLIDDGVTGLLVRPAHPPSIAHAVGALLADQALRARLGAEAQRVATESFTSAAYVARLATLYDALLERHGIVPVAP
jgi:glycosyltransferase involved in cell wall biosynthesis